MNKINIISVFFILAMTGCTQDANSPAVAEGQVASASADASTENALESGAPDVATLVANADPALGKRQYIFCQACHSTEPGGANKIGPNLSGVIGRDAAKGPGFIYSAALSDSGVVWDVAALDQWIENPAAMVPGTTMVFAGIRDPEQRANLIAYLQEVASPLN